MTRAEAIVEARRMMKDGEFMRRVTGTMPDDIYWDAVALDCGHSTQWSPFADQSDLPERVRCRQCAEAWIKAQSAIEAPK